MNQVGHLSEAKTHSVANLVEEDGEVNTSMVRKPERERPRAAPENLGIEGGGVNVDSVAGLTMFLG